jgi:hypothetical protein
MGSDHVKQRNDREPSARLLSCEKSLSAGHAKIVHPAADEAELLALTDGPSGGASRIT